MQGCWRKKQHFDDIVQKYHLLLNETRGLISENDRNKLFNSLGELLDRVAADPYKILKHDPKHKHVYIAKFDALERKRFIMFVTKSDGTLETAYLKKPSFTEKDGFFVIYESKK